MAANTSLAAERGAWSEPFPVDEARALHLQGLDSKAIADELCVPWVVVIEWYVRQRSLSPNPPLVHQGIRHQHREEATRRFLVRQPA